jgi:KDO2-lipid IV(A) lauroyltransferase
MSGSMAKVTLLIKDIGGLFLYYPGQALLNRVPRTTLDRAAQAGGGLVQRLGSAEMEAELAAISKTYPIPDPEAVLKRAFQLTMFNELEVMRYPFLNPNTIEQTASLEGKEHLDAALKKGKGAIILIGHFGANQMIMPMLGHLGYPMNQLSAPPPVWAEILKETRTTPLWEKVLERRWELEKKLPVRHINVFRFLRPAFECLERNEVLGLAFDGGGGKKWIQVDFLGRRANLSAEPARIWQKTKAVLLPTFVYRSPGDSKHRVVITEPLAWAGNPEASLQAFVQRFEQEVLKYPDHYLHFLAMRRRVRGTDITPFFTDYPPAASALSPEEAEERLKRAGSWRDKDER